jgi:hypothetical protein
MSELPKKVCTLYNYTDSLNFKYEGNLVLSFSRKARICVSCFVYDTESQFCLSLLRRVDMNNCFSREFLVDSAESLFDSSGYCYIAK